MILEVTNSDPTFWLHWIVTGVITAGVFVLWYQYTKNQDQRDKAVDLLVTNFGSYKEKITSEMKELNNEFWTEMNKVKDNHDTKFSEVNNSLHEMKDSLMKELTEIKVSVANINRGKSSNN